MTRIDKILKELSDLYEFNRKIKAYDLNKQPENRWRNAEKRMMLSKRQCIAII